MKKGWRILLCILCIILLPATIVYAKEEPLYDNTNWIPVSSGELVELYQAKEPFIAYCYFNELDEVSIFNAEYLMDSCGLKLYSYNSGVPGYLYINASIVPDGGFQEGCIIFDGENIYIYSENDIEPLYECLQRIYPQIDVSGLGLAELEFLNLKHRVIYEVNKYIYGSYSTHDYLVSRFSKEYDLISDEVYNAAWEIVNTVNASTDYEKAYALYRWIGDNVVYDYDNLGYGSYADDVYTYRLAQCIGYAKLYTAFCRAVGLSARYVGGALFDTIDEIPEAIITQCESFIETHDPHYLLQTSGHAWVEVFIDGRWVITDPTGSPYGDRNFDCDLKVFSRTHLYQPQEFNDINVEYYGRNVIRLDDEVNDNTIAVAAKYDIHGRLIGIESPNIIEDYVEVNVTKDVHWMKVFILDEAYNPISSPYIYTDSPYIPLVEYQTYKWK